jgi:hypothetical protein
VFVEIADAEFGIIRFVEKENGINSPSEKVKSIVFR